MSSIKKLTPAILKRIIREEKDKLRKQKDSKKKSVVAETKKDSNTKSRKLSESIEALEKLIIKEAVYRLKASKIKSKRAQIKKHLKNLQGKQ